VSKGLGLMNATFKDAMSFGTFLAMAIPFLVGVCLAHKGILRIFSLLLLFVSAYLILFTGSKSAFLSLISSLIIFLFFAVKAKRVSPAILMVLLLVAVLVFYAIVLEKSLPEEIAKSKTFVRLKDFGSMLALRTGTLWKIALSMTKDFPLTGVGLGAYIIETSDYAAVMKLNIGVPESAENLLLHIREARTHILAFTRRNCPSAPPASSWHIQKDVAWLDLRGASPQIRTHEEKMDQKWEPICED
jgi:O-antigen ligase